MTTINIDREAELEQEVAELRETVEHCKEIAGGNLRLINKNAAQQSTIHLLAGKLEEAGKILSSRNSYYGQEYKELAAKYRGDL